jgi:hypothetical protein
MANQGKLKIVLTNVNRKPLAEDVDVKLRHQTTGHEMRVRLRAGKSTVIEDLRAQPDGFYRIEIDPPSYLAVGAFVSVKSKGTTTLGLTCPVDPNKVQRVQFPKYTALADEAKRLLDVSDAVLGFEGRSGAAFYDGLDDIRKAGLLNIVTKTLNTTFGTRRSVLSYVDRLTELRGDRFFALVRKELREEARNAVLTGQFEKVSGSLHRPPDGFDEAGSFKTDDRYGNLQLTFFARGDEWRADIDIDDAAGIGHVFQVLRNTLKDRTTHPYDINQLLVHHQQLDPGYLLLV